MAMTLAKREEINRAAQMPYRPPRNKCMRVHGYQNTQEITNPFTNAIILRNIVTIYTETRTRRDIAPVYMDSRTLRDSVPLYTRISEHQEIVCPCIHEYQNTKR